MITWPAYCWQDQPSYHLQNSILIIGPTEGPWPPLVTGLPGLHDNAASADAVGEALLRTP